MNSLVIDRLVLTPLTLAGALARRFGYSVVPAYVLVGFAIGFSALEAAFPAPAGTTRTLQETIPALTVGYVLVTSIAGTVLVRYAGEIEGLRQRLQRSVTGQPSAE